MRISFDMLANGGAGDGVAVSQVAPHWFDRPASGVGLASLDGLLSAQPHQRSFNLGPVLYVLVPHTPC
jgi:hypothetical protein